jgi:hypothetical protein
MSPLYIPPICLVPKCQQARQILSKEGSSTRYMLTCRSHYAGLISKKDTKTA